jgi:hypothetical protein
MIFVPTFPLRGFGMPTPHFVAFAANLQISAAASGMK